MNQTTKSIVVLWRVVVQLYRKYVFTGSGSQTRLIWSKPFLSRASRLWNVWRSCVPGFVAIRSVVKNTLWFTKQVPLSTSRRCTRLQRGLYITILKLIISSYYLGTDFFQWNYKSVSRVKGRGVDVVDNDNFSYAFMKVDTPESVWVTISETEYCVMCLD